MDFDDFSLLVAINHIRSAQRSCGDYATIMRWSHEHWGLKFSEYPESKTKVEGIGSIRCHRSVRALRC